jgi:Domain of unknown function (DUF6894)
VPRYFFHVRVNGELIMDSDGLELSDSYRARDECSRAVRQLIDEDEGSELTPPEFEFYVVDDAGRIVAVIPFHS